MGGSWPLDQMTETSTYGWSDTPLLKIVLLQATIVRVFVQEINDKSTYSLKWWRNLRERPCKKYYVRGASGNLGSLIKHSRVRSNDWWVEFCSVMTSNEIVGWEAFHPIALSLVGLA